MYKFTVHRKSGQISTIMHAHHVFSSCLESQRVAPGALFWDLFWLYFIHLLGQCKPKKRIKCVYIKKVWSYKFSRAFILPIKVTVFSVWYKVCRIPHMAIKIGSNVILSFMGRDPIGETANFPCPWYWNVMYLYWIYRALQL